MDKRCKEQLKQERLSGRADNRFDINLAEGKFSEELIESLLNGSTTIEVKKDYVVSRTGNVAVEVLHHGVPSGISTSEAEFYAFVLGGDEYNDEIIIFIKKNRLWDIVEKLIIDGKLRYAKRLGESDFVPLPIKELIKPKSEI